MLGLEDLENKEDDSLKKTRDTYPKVAHTGGHKKKLGGHGEEHQDGGGQGGGRATTPAGAGSNRSVGTNGKGPVPVVKKDKDEKPASSRKFATTGTATGTTSVRDHHSESTSKEDETAAKEVSTRHTAPKDRKLGTATGTSVKEQHSSTTSTAKEPTKSTRETSSTPKDHKGSSKESTRHTTPHKSTKQDEHEAATETNTKESTREAKESTRVETTPKHSKKHKDDALAQAHAGEKLSAVGGSILDDGPVSVGEHDHVNRFKGMLELNADVFEGEEHDAERYTAVSGGRHTAGGATTTSTTSGHQHGSRSGSPGGRGTGHGSGATTHRSATATTSTTGARNHDPNNLGSAIREASTRKSARTTLVRAQDEGANEPATANGGSIHLVDRNPTASVIRHSRELHSQVYVSREMQLVEEVIHFVERAAVEPATQSDVDAFVGYLALVVQFQKPGSMKVTTRWRRARVLLRLMALVESGGKWTVHGARSGQAAGAQAVAAQHSILDDEIDRQYDLDAALFVGAEQCFWQDTGTAGASHKAKSFRAGREAPSTTSQQGAGSLSTQGQAQGHVVGIKPGEAHSKKSPTRLLQNQQNWQTFLLVLKFLAIMLPNDALMATHTEKEIRDLPPDEKGTYWAPASISLLDKTELAILQKNPFYMQLEAAAKEFERSKRSGKFSTVVTRSSTRGAFAGTSQLFGGSDIFGGQQNTAAEVRATVSSLVHQSVKDALAHSRQMTSKVERELEVLTLICKMRQGDDSAFRRLGTLSLSEPKVKMRGSEIATEALFGGDLSTVARMDMEQSRPARGLLGESTTRDSSLRATTQERTTTGGAQGDLFVRGKGSTQVSLQDNTDPNARSGQRRHFSRASEVKNSTVNAGRLRTYMGCVTAALTASDQQKGTELTAQDRGALNYLQKVGQTIDPAQSLAHHREHGKLDEHLENAGHESYNRAKVSDRWDKVSVYSKHVGRASTVMESPAIAEAHAKQQAHMVRETGMFPLSGHHDHAHGLIDSAKQLQAKASTTSGLVGLVGMDTWMKESGGGTGRFRRQQNRDVVSQSTSTGELLKLMTNEHRRSQSRAGSVDRETSGETITARSGSLTARTGSGLRSRFNRSRSPSPTAGANKSATSGLLAMVQVAKKSATTGAANLSTTKDVIAAAKQEKAEAAQRELEAQAARQRAAEEAAAREEEERERQRASSQRSYTMEDTSRGFTGFTEYHPSAPQWSPNNSGPGTQMSGATSAGPASARIGNQFGGGDGLQGKEKLLGESFQLQKARLEAEARQKQLEEQARRERELAAKQQAQKERQARQQEAKKLMALQVQHKVDVVKSGPGPVVALDSTLSGRGQKPDAISTSSSSAVVSLHSAGGPPAGDGPGGGRPSAIAPEIRNAAKSPEDENSKQRVDPDAGRPTLSDEEFWWEGPVGDVASPWEFMSGWRITSMSRRRCFRRIISQK
ncbi:unnamed protein product [Amoebophrya sp. A25]|nr:unnamed protein product [Amoebophrya sp. A25]|eukprot:GSA25T00001642001.1